MITYTILYSTKEAPDDKIFQQGVLRDYPAHRRHLKNEMLSAISLYDYKLTGCEGSMDDIIIHSFKSGEE